MYAFATISLVSAKRPSPALLQCLLAAKDLMDSSYSEPIDLGGIAARAGYSRYHFLRAFRAAYGETPRAYLTRRRVERARDLLRSANLTVTEICYLVGFSSLGSFSSRFTELVGVTPTEYRAEWERLNPSPRVPGCILMMWTRLSAGADSSNREEVVRGPRALR
jgi:AraC-like DNA-binding protein